MTVFYRFWIFDLDSHSVMVDNIDQAIDNPAMLTELVASDDFECSLSLWILSRHSHTLT